MSTHEIDVQTLVVSMRRLERQVRFWKRLVSLFLLFAAVTVSVGSGILQDTPNIVTAKQGFAVTDKEGNVRAFLGFAEDGRIGLSLSDDKHHGRLTISLSRNNDEYGIYINDADDNSRMFSGFRKKTYASEFYDDKNTTRLEIGALAASGMSSMVIRDESGVPRLLLGEFLRRGIHSRIAGLFLLDAKTNDRAQIYNSDNEGSAIRLFDGGGEFPRIVLGVNGGDEKARLEIFGKTGHKPRVAVDVDPGNSLTFELTDKGNRTISLLQPDEKNGKKREK